ncbi:MAG TPA: S-methyl-5'-thioadenosine phosphorylase [Microvirga sp.]|jgi:5'-methylthioadenosine phosphorylase|nr:S-methyl-5'-thioadenosine phosphorylase [Microvirga sp.]
MTKAVLGVIGGSGVYDLPGLEDVREARIPSPWGEPSDALRFGRLGATEVVFLPRHGRGHRYSPSDIDYRANIDALKRAGVTDLVSVSACGSFRAEYHPGFFVLVDQFVDRTFRRESSFFGKGCVAHVPMAHPVGPTLQRRIADAAVAENVPFRLGGTYVCIEGPQFSTYAESLTYRSHGYDVIGMTAMPEAKLAREAEITYATIAMVTDYDCWHPEHDDVDVASVVAVAQRNARTVAALIARLARDFPAERDICPHGSDRALDGAVMTAPSARDPELVRKLDAVAGRVLSPGRE